MQGRLAAKATLVHRFGADAQDWSVLYDATGAPVVRPGPGCGVSLSHDGPWVAVAVADGAKTRVGVDICLRGHGPRLMRILSRLGLSGRDLAPEVQWAALECVLKIHRLAVTRLLSESLRVRVVGREVEVVGFGETNRVSFLSTPLWAVAWATEVS